MSLVADPDNKTNNPEAKGSRVPVWPVRARVRARTCRTTANDDGPAGLSTRITPDGSSPRGGILACPRPARLRGRPAGGCELAADELGDLLDGGVAREAGRLPVAAAARASRDRGHVELVDARAQADPSGRP